MDQPTDELVKLGEGATGVVYRMTNISFALKQIPLDQVEQAIAFKAFSEICSLIEELNHDNIVEIVAVHHSDDGIWLLLEYLDMNVKKYIATHPELRKDQDQKEKLFQDILRQLLLGVSYCHSHEIVHGNLKPKKLLWDSKTNTLKIGDFGLARALGTLRRKETQEVGRLWYMAPELLLGSKDYSKAVDIWSVGCIFALMLRGGRPLFRGDNELQTLVMIFCLTGTPTEKAWRELPPYEPLRLVEWKPLDLKMVFRGCDPVGIDLLSRMLCVDPAERITAEDALAHSFFNNA